MKRLKKIENIVEQILDTREEARRSDDILYLYVCECFNEGISSATLKNFLTTRSETACPTFASVTRVRRKVFKKRPELKPKEITKLREEMVDVYMDYAING